VVCDGLGAVSVEATVRKVMDVVPDVRECGASEEVSQESKAETYCDGKERLREVGRRCEWHQVSTVSDSLCREMAM